MHAPASQLARGEATNATTSATSSGLPNRPNGSSRLTMSAMASGSAFCRRSQLPPGNKIDPGARTVGGRYIGDYRRVRSAAGGRELGGERREIRLAARDRRYTCTFARERKRDRATDATARAGDEAQLAAEAEIHQGSSHVWP